MIFFEEISGFDWDKGNIDKNWEKHKVSNSEIEQLFFNEPLVYEDREHSLEERRLYALGETDAGRRLFVGFTIRKDKIRVITSRPMSNKERKVYDGGQ